MQCENAGLTGAFALPIYNSVLYAAMRTGDGVRPDLLFGF